MTKRTVVTTSGHEVTAYDFETAKSVDDLLEEMRATGAIRIPVGGNQRKGAHMDKVQREGLVLAAFVVSIW